MPFDDTPLFSFDYNTTLWLLGVELRWPNDSISKQFPFIKLGKPHVINTTQEPKYLHLRVYMWKYIWVTSFKIVK